MITNNEKLINIENKILEIFNNNQVTSDEFQKIIDDISYQKEHAYLVFSQKDDSNSVMRTIIDSVNIDIDEEQLFRSRVSFL